MRARMRLRRPRRRSGDAAKSRAAACAHRRRDVGRDAVLARDRARSGRALGASHAAGAAHEARVPVAARFARRRRAARRRERGAVRAGQRAARQSSRRAAGQTRRVLADEIIAAAKPGARIPASAPFGSGFPVEEAHGRDVILFAAGSGITPVRALLQWLLARRDHGSSRSTTGSAASTTSPISASTRLARAASTSSCASRSRRRVDGRARLRADGGRELAARDRVATRWPFCAACSPMVDDVRRRA